eukprot:1149962-Pelagomonas_calceolata.AAC.2
MHAKSTKLSPGGRPTGSSAMLAASSWMPGPWQAWLGSLRAAGGGDTGLRHLASRGLELELVPGGPFSAQALMSPKFDLLISTSNGVRMP